MTLHYARRIDLVIGRGLTLANFAERLSGIWGDRVLMTDGASGETLTYRQANELVTAYSNAIAAKIQPHDRVVLATPNTYHQFLACLAVARAGGIAVPINPQMRPAEISHVEKDSGAVLCIRDVSELMGEFPTVAPARPGAEDVAALMYTSGTTGAPKGAALSHRSLLGQSAFATLFPANLRHDEVVVALPVAHIMGFATLIGLMSAGLAVYFSERFRAAETLVAIESRRAAAFVGVPAMYRMMAEAGAAEKDLSSVRLWMSGADVMPPDLIRLFKRYGSSAKVPLIGSVGEAAFVEGYGMVEVGGGVAAKVSPPMIPVGFGDALGFRLPGYKFKVVDEGDKAVSIGHTGELLIRGPGVLREYWNSPEATTAALTSDGWLRTGDLVRVGPFGTIIFSGRKKHTVKCGGFSVYPLEVEAALEEHPEVLEASVIGLPDKTLGEVPCAVVRVAPGSALAEETLLAWAEDRLSHYKSPRKIRFVDELPRTGTGKVQKEHLLELFAS